jgi:hypothetical protein
MVRIFQRSHECFAQVAGAAGNKNFHIDFRLYNIRPDAKEVMTYRVATGPSTATPITNRDAAIFEMSRAADDYSNLALSRLLHEGGPTFSQPEEYL